MSSVSKSRQRLRAPPCIVEMNRNCSRWARCCSARTRAQPGRCYTDPTARLRTGLLWPQARAWAFSAVQLAFYSPPQLRGNGQRWGHIVARRMPLGSRFRL